jgi:hypothetical protein
MTSEVDIDFDEKNNTLYEKYANELDIVKRLYGIGQNEIMLLMDFPEPEEAIGYDELRHIFIPEEPMQFSESCCGQIADYSLVLKVAASLDTTKDSHKLFDDAFSGLKRRGMIYKEHDEHGKKVCGLKFYGIEVREYIGKKFPSIVEMWNTSVI